METPDASALTLWAALGQTYLLLNKHLEKVMNGEGSSAAMAAALFALRQPGMPIRLSHLAHILVQEPQSITALVDRLEKAGLVRRSAHARDRRVINVSLTQAGERLVERLGIAAEQALAENLHVLEPRAQETLFRTLQTLRGHGAEVAKYPVVPFEDRAATESKGS